MAWIIPTLIGAVIASLAAMLIGVVAITAFEMLKDTTHD